MDRGQGGISGPAELMMHSARTETYTPTQFSKESTKSTKFGYNSELIILMFFLRVLRVLRGDLLVASLVAAPPLG